MAIDLSTQTIADLAFEGTAKTTRTANNLPTRSDRDTELKEKHARIAEEILGGI